MSANRDKKQFDEWVDRESQSSKRPPFLVDAIMWIGDGLEGALLAARATFGKDAKPEHALKVFELALIQREKLEAEFQAKLKQAKTASRMAKKKA